MKKILMPVLLLCCVLTISCKKTDQPHALFIGATLKNTNWVAQPSTSYFANKDSVQIQGINSTDYETLSLKLRFTGVGNYTIAGKQAAFYVTVAPPDGAIAYYRLDTTQTNTFTIDQFNVQTNIASGKFQLHFVGGTATNTLDLTNGTFWIQMPPLN